MRAVGRVIGARRNQFDGVGAEYREVTDVALPIGHIPAVVGVSLGGDIPADGRAADTWARHGYRAGVEGSRNRGAFPERTQQTADSEQHTALVVAGDLNAAIERSEPIAFRG